MYYFAYGSNMLTERLEKRVGTVKDIGTAVLEGYCLKFNKQSVDGSGKTNIVPKESFEVFGVVYELEDSQKIKLDKSEVGYSRKELKISFNSSLIPMDVYVAEQGSINEELLPTEEYLNYLIQGATEHNFPKDYIEFLKQIKVLAK